MANIKPLGQRVLVKRIEAETKTAGGLFLPDTAKEKPQEAEVISVGTVLVDRTQGLGGNLHFHELTEFRNPDALLLKVGENGTIDSLSDVTTNTALFLGKTGAMDTTTFVRHGTSDDANSGHGNRSYLLMRER